MPPGSDGRPDPPPKSLWEFLPPGALRDQALTHPSYAHEHPGRAGRDNQRLEFLGDAVLGLAVAHLLHEGFPERSEGDLTRFRAALVSEGCLARKARAAGIGPLLRLGCGEAATGGRDKPSVLAAAMEACLGAVYLTVGFEGVLALCAGLWGPDLEALAAGPVPGDFKTRLQEWAQARGVPLEYRVLREEGPPHDRTFLVAVRVGGQTAGEGRGRSLKAAEQEAARVALERVEAPADDGKA